ncbi:B-cell receptor CD22 isoform X1 [Amia ocellicauda]|uniref:B-cell receptor CD22 isoform X1 n=1 Tax=Amia ocellicauda TaxID=2972642 RepID=UPI0034639576
MAVTEGFLLIACLLRGVICTETLPGFSISMPASVAALSGSCVLIPCQFEVADGFKDKVKDLKTALWREGSAEGPTVLESNGPGSQEPGEIIGDFRAKNCTTILNNIQKSDNYHFRIGEPIKFTYRTPVKIEVTDNPPKLMKDDQVKERTPMKLSCSAAAPCPTLPPALTWTPRMNGTVDHQEVENQDKTKSVSSVLTFTASHLHHGLNISCTALYPLQQLNHSTTAEATVTLSVLYSPKDTSASVSPSSSVSEGSSVTLTCSSNANSPVSNYTWVKVNGDQVTPRGSGQNLTFSVTASDSGQYYCEAQNEHGVGKATVQLDVRYSPKDTSASVSPSSSVSEGSSVTLTCSSNANPPVSNYTWVKVNGDQVTPRGSGQNLTFSVTASDSGQYYCEAQNEHGVGKATVQLDVRYSPKDTSASVSPSSSVSEGSSVTLTCSSNANPPVSNYTWVKVNGDQVTPRGSGQNLTFSVTASDSGQYYCEAQNEHGVGNATVQLDVQYSPKDTSASVSPSSSVSEGSSVTLTCSSNANPPVSNYTWVKVNGDQVTPRGSGQNLTFSVAASDSGQYYCEAQNEHGVGNATVQLYVRYMPEIVNASPCIRNTADITCQCESHGHPSPSTEWLLSGQRLSSDSVVSVIRKEQLDSRALRSTLTLVKTLGQTDTIECLSRNTAGSSRLLFQIPPSGQEGPFSTSGLLIGGAVGALLMSLLCCLIQTIKPRTHRPSEPCTKMEDTAKLSGKQPRLQQDEDMVYANNAILLDERREAPGELLYATVDFSKLQHKESTSKSESTVIRSSSENHTDYAKIKCKPKCQRQEPAVPSQLEKVKNTVDHCPVNMEPNLEVRKKAPSKDYRSDGKEQELPPPSQEKEYGNIQRPATRKQEEGDGDGQSI